MSFVITGYFNFIIEILIYIEIKLKYDLFYSILKTLNLNLYHKYILVTVLICFTIAANLAWLNPHPNSKVHKTTEEIPFFWQYNDDAGVQILTTAYFPKIFHTYKDRMERPTFPILSKVLGEAVGIIILPIKKLSQLEKAGAGILLLKIFIFSLFSIITFEIFSNYMPKEYSFLAIFLFLTHEFTIKSLSMFHTLELQFITPVIISYFFLNLLKKYTHSKNIIFSIIVGILILAKSNYAFYIGFLIFSLINKRFLESVLSFVVHLLPLALYLLYLKILDFEFYSLQKDYGMGVWLLNSNFLILKNSLYLLIESIKNFTVATFYNFHILIFAAIFGFFKLEDNLRKNYFLIILILIFMTWFQQFFSNRYRPYMSADISIIVFCLSSFWLFKLKPNIQNTKFILIPISILWLTVNLLLIANFPLIHPKYHPERNSDVMTQRLDMVENYENYTDEDRRNAKGGVLLSK